MFRKALLPNLVTSRFPIKSFSSISSENFHLQNKVHLKDLLMKGNITPLCPAYLKSRVFFFRSKVEGQADIDAPTGDKSYLTREELTKYPTPLDFLLKDNGNGLIEAIERFPDSEDSTSSPKP